MRRSLVASGVVALALAAPAAAGLPQSGSLRPARSLGGVHIGEPQRAVRAALGTFYGVCQGCTRRTWYFTYRPFSRRGLAVELDAGRVSAVYTLWEPVGWQAANGLHLGAKIPEVRARAGRLRRVSCHGYAALVADTRRVRTVYYVYAGSLWGFGLFRRGAGPCR